LAEDRAFSIETENLKEADMDVSYIALFVSVAGFITAVAAYRRSINVKTLDLRIELRKAENALRNTVDKLPDVLRSAKQSHERVMAATGMALSGNMQSWSNEFSVDWSEWTRLHDGLPEQQDYSGLRDTELEEKLIEVDKLAIRANALQKKYESSYAADDVMRGKLRDEAAARAIASKKPPGT
jgi:hypothetical protein